MYACTQIPSNYNIAIDKNMFHPYHLQLSEVTMHVFI